MIESTTWVMSKTYDLIIPESENSQPHLAQYLLPSFIFLFLQVVDIAIDLHNQPRLVTIKINNESLNDLLPSEMNTKLIRS